MLGEVSQRVLPEEAPPARPAPVEPKPPPGPPPAMLGRPTTRCATVVEVLGLAKECGLAEHLDAVEALVAPSIRMTHDPEVGAGGRSAFGERAGSSSGDAAVGELALLVHLESSEVEAAAPPGLSLPLPLDGGLDLLLREPDAAALPAAPAVVVERGDRTDMPGPCITFSSELVLPRVWADAVQRFEFDADARSGWDDLRRRLATAQGIDPWDGPGAPQPVPRLFGYAEERNGDMPLACELLARGADVDTSCPQAHPLAAECEPAAMRWRLLLHLGTGWRRPGSRERLFVWIDEADLAAGDLSRIQAIQR
jgi:hypothetical protein